MELATEPRRAAVVRRRVCEQPGDFVANWFFPIAMPAFQAALDIERSERAETIKGPDDTKRRRTWYVWTQRSEPHWAFVVGDIFHAPPAAPGSWGEQREILRWTVQVKGVLDRTVTIAVTEHREARCSEHVITMTDLATLLRTGRLAPFFDLASDETFRLTGDVG